MKTDFRMKASVQEVYGTLLDSVIAEARMYAGKQISEKDLASGYKYHRKVRKSGREQDVVVHIRKPVENRNIHIMSAYPQESFEMDYLLEKIDDTHTMIHYEQTGSREKDRKAGLLFRWGMKRRFKQLETYIRRSRKSW
ncbi:MAG: DUF3284 domain-containing protein [Erysipelotrichaceae bacterium]|nr:DUF3284 domain-containing protein [Erysipelotrichaceae bacterium]